MSSTRLNIVWSFIFILCLMTMFSCESRHEVEDMNTLSQEVWEMRQCQRKADNLHFYLHKYRAEKIIKEYEGDYSQLNASCQREFMLANGRYNIVLADYLMQIGNHKEAIKVMDKLAASNTLNLNADTMLWLNYLTHQGEVHFIPVDIQKNKANIEKGYDCLMQCYILASRNNISLYKAVSMQMLSRYLLIPDIMTTVKAFDAASLRYINEDGVPECLLAGNLAERALNIMLQQKDPYLTISAWEDLAKCYFGIGDAETSLECLNIAMANPALDSMPDLKASISEQMSMTYAALDNKHGSDFYRNMYLDLQDSTRQDKQMQARALTLEQKTQKIWILVSIAFGLFVLLCVTTLVLIRLRQIKQKKSSSLEDEIEELEERLKMSEIQNSDALRAQIELKAQVSVINGMLPLIERMRNAIERGDDAYAQEVARDIDQQNACLTKWIKLQQGAIAPKIETVSVSEIFDIVSQKEKNGAGVVINVMDTSTRVKADRTLTLFIINTLIENAKKALGESGTITVSCEDNKEEHYAEISVSDTGKGMTQEQIDHLFEVKPIKDESFGMRDEEITHQSHGFGLQNCRGIINRYRKISSLFSVCDITAKSRVGDGTTISFRLPLVLKMLILVLCLSLNVSAHNDIEGFADSLYINNVHGDYAKAMQYSDSCNAIIKANNGNVRIGTKLSVFNETAVAALALHEWNKYIYYNYLYTNLYKGYTEDKSLPAYIEKMSSNELIANITMLIVILLILSLLPVFWFVYLKPLVRFRKDKYRQKQHLNEETERWKRETNRLHVMNNVVSNQLSTVKHETMYYPSRISQMMSQNDDRSEIRDTVTYYSQLYMLLSTKMISEQLNGSQFTVHGSQLCGRNIIANDELLSYLLLLLKRHNGGKKPEAEVTNETDKYVTISFLMDKGEFMEKEIPELFTMNTIHTDYLVMRQIMREIGNSSMRYGVGIRALCEVGKQKISVTFPKK